MQTSIFLIAKLLVTETYYLLSARKKKKTQTSPAAENCPGEEGLSSSEERKAKAEEKMDQINPEGLRDPVEVSTPQGCFKWQLPA